MRSFYAILLVINIRLFVALIDIPIGDVSLNSNVSCPGESVSVSFAEFSMEMKTPETALLIFGVTQDIVPSHEASHRLYLHGKG
jgi:hypothetical protein